MANNRVSCPSVYFQVWDHGKLAISDFYRNIPDAVAVFERYKSYHPDATLRVYHLVRAKV